MWNELTLGFLIALGSAVCWALLDVSRKELGRKMTATGAVAGLMLLHLLYLNPVLVAGTVSEVGESGAMGVLLSGYPEVPGRYWVPASVSVGLNLLANLLFLRAVQVSPLSLTTPYLAFTPVFTAVVALVFLGQVPTVAGWVGISIVCGGAFMMNPGDKEDGVWAPVKALWTERGSLYMVIVALLWSITPVLDKTASEMTNPLWHTMVLAGGVGVIFGVWRWGRDRSLRPLVEEFRVVPVVLVLGGLFAVGAMVLQLISYAYVDVAYVETIKRAVGVTAAIMAGYFLFGERDLLRRLVGALVMVVGVALILMAG